MGGVSRHGHFGQLIIDLHRLLEQLSDLEKDREELGEEEYTEMRQDTLEQVSTFWGWDELFGFAL